VAQRRRRVFACVAFGDSAADRAGRTLLAVSEGVRGDSASGGSEGQGVAGVVAAGVGDASGVAHTLTGNGFDASEDGTGRGTPIVPQAALTESAYVVEPQSFNWQSGGDARGLDLTDEPSALSTSQTPAVLLTIRAGKPGGGKGPLLAEEQSLTLATGNGQTLFQPDTRTTHAIVEPTHDCYTAGDENVPQAHRVYRAQGNAPALGASAGMVPNVLAYGVRRLTPVECERLQSFPDGWTEPAGSDSARYKAMGNAVTVNVVRWILGRLP
jgi:DNA (cytosine-5)-methyltransferase 1